MQKWDDELCPRVDDYPIFFATMREPSKDNSGDKIFVKLKDMLPPTPSRPPLVRGGDDCSLPDKEGLGWVDGRDGVVVSEAVNRYEVTPQDLNEFVLDEHEHLVVKHDLFSHELKNGKRTQAGIAEAFIEFAKKERLSFFR